MFTGLADDPNCARHVEDLSRSLREHRASCAGSCRLQPLFQHPAKTHILLPVLSVECYSRGGHELMPAFPLNSLSYG